jgi:hypothetical protein
MQNKPIKLYAVVLCMSTYNLIGFYRATKQGHLHKKEARLFSGELLFNFVYYFVALVLSIIRIICFKPLYTYALLISIPLNIII